MRLPMSTSATHAGGGLVLVPQTHVDLIEKLLNYNTLERRPAQGAGPAQQQGSQQQPQG